MLLIQPKQEKIVIDVKNGSHKEIECVAQILFAIAATLSTEAPQARMIIRKKKSELPSRA